MSINKSELNLDKSIDDRFFDSRFTFNESSYFEEQDTPNKNLTTKKENMESNATLNATTESSNADNNRVQIRPPFQHVNVQSDHKLTVAYQHAQAYLNLFKPSKVETWFEECASLFKAAQVPTTTIVFNILTCCNTYLPHSKQIEWTTTMDLATAKAFLIKAFRVSHEEKVHKALEKETWRNKTYSAQLKDLTDAFGSNYELIKEFLMKRFPENQQTMAFTTLQALEQDEGLRPEKRLSEWTRTLDQYCTSFANKEPSRQINWIKEQDDNIAPATDKFQQQQIQNQQVMMQTLQGVINSIEKLQVQTNKDQKTVKQTENWQPNYEKPNKTNDGQPVPLWRNSNYRNETHNRNYYTRQDNYRRQGGRRRQINICHEHLIYGPRYRANNCAAGCKEHPAQLCYGHARFGEAAWKENCEPFCRRFRDQKN